MSDYKVVSHDLKDRFSAMLDDYKGDFEEEIVVASLMSHYDRNEGDTDLLWAIDRVLSDYMAPLDYLAWSRAKSLSNLARIDEEDDLI